MIVHGDEWHNGSTLLILSRNDRIIYIIYIERENYRYRYIMIYHLILTLCLLLKIAKDSSQFRFPVSGHHRLNRTAWLAALATPPYGVQHLARCMGKNGLSINRWYKPF